MNYNSLVQINFPDCNLQNSKDKRTLGKTSIKQCKIRCICKFNFGRGTGYDAVEFDWPLDLVQGTRLSNLTGHWTWYRGQRCRIWLAIGPDTRDNAVEFDSPLDPQGLTSPFKQQQFRSLLVGMWGLRGRSNGKQVLVAYFRASPKLCRKRIGEWRYCCFHC